MDLEQRVEKLERENLRLKLAGGVLGTAFAVVALTAATMPQGSAGVVEAREYRIVDDDSVTRVVMNVQAVSHYDENGNLRARLVTSTPGAEVPYTATIVLYDEAGNVIWRGQR